MAMRSIVLFLAVLLLTSCQTESARTPLTDPASFDGQAISTQIIRLTWSPVAQADGYQLERKTAAEPFQPLVSLEAAEQSWHDEGLRPGVTYVYRLTASRGNEVSDGKEISVTTTALSGPDSFTATALSDSMVELTWTSAPGATLYNLARAQNGDVELVIEIDGQATRFTDSLLDPNTRYTYQLTAEGVDGWSAEAEVTTYSDVRDPDNLVAKARASDAIALSWFRVAEAKGYLVERKEGDAAFTSLATLGADQTDYVDEGLKPDTRYTYRVSTQGAGGSSPGVEVLRRTFDEKVWSEPIDTKRPFHSYEKIVLPRKNGGATLLERDRDDESIWYLTQVSPSGEWGEAQQLPTTTTRIDAATINEAGALLIAWKQFNRVAIKRYDPATGWQETEFVATGKEYEIIGIGLSVDSNGNAALLFSDFEQVFGTSVEKGRAWNPPVLVDQIENSEAEFYGIYELGIQHDSSGDAIAHYRFHRGKGSTLERALLVVRFENSAWSQPVTLSEQTGDDFELALNDDDSALMVWSGSGIMAAFFNPSRGWGEPEVVAYQGLRGLRLAGNGQGSFLLTWGQHTSPVYARSYVEGQGWGDTLTLGDAYDAYQVLGTMLSARGEGIVLVEDSVILSTSGCSRMGFLAWRYLPEAGWSALQRIDKDICDSPGNLRAWRDGKGDFVVTFQQDNGESDPYATLLTTLK